MYCNIYGILVSLTSPPLSPFVREEAIVPEPMGLFYNARPLEGLKRLANESIYCTIWCNAFPSKQRLGTDADQTSAGYPLFNTTTHRRSVPLVLLALG
ncbi:hypothetical protein E2C01_010793 [Portunus trituberculatus]|uniref:Uncharacterized protein n=1 Tax=Portunus trituberculatus TaxID=210409 RepID=A0A5B7D9P1_PORTR|nr:hypothetical protein [Portunus trituberculatus]